MKDYNLENRRYVIAGVAITIVVIYTIRLFTLQLLSDDYKKNADSNAFLKKIEYPSRGIITDRHGKLMVYNQPAYDIMVVMNEQKGRIDTLEFCEALGITKEFYQQRMTEIKDRNKNPGYSRFTQQLFMSQLSDKEFSIFQEKMYRDVYKRQVLERSIELSSMGIRVDKESLLRQLKLENQEDKQQLYFHQQLLNDKLPLSMGGGIGQSRLCMVLLQKAHIGEIQASIWPEDMRKECAAAGMKLI